MLTELLVKNLALAEDISVHWGAGLSVLTGETGAGKSMVIGALTLLLGARGSADQVRVGCETALVEGYFDIEGLAEVEAALQDMGLADEGSELVLSRELGRSGKSRCRINGRVVSASQVRSLGSLLIDICGQHENQSLFSAAKQLALVDRLGGPELWRLRQEVGALYAELEALASERAGLLKDSRELARRIDLLQHQSAEIRASGVSSMDEEAMRQDKTRLANADRLLTESSRIYELLCDSGPTDSPVADSLARAVHTVEALEKLDPSLSEVSSLLVEAHDASREAARQLRQYREGIDYDPSRLARIEDDLEALSGLKRKYGDSVADIVAYGEAVESELSSFSSRSDRLDWLDGQVEAVTKRYLDTTRVVTALRTDVARRASELLNVELRDLGMPSSSFEVRLESRLPDHAEGADRAGYTSTGVDMVEFLFTANAGEELGSLNRVASGGELSRILLALKTVMGRFDDTPTMVFDEIDAGLGGRTAKAVAEKLSAISLRRQVICVTHLAQIACMGDQQFSIQKAVSNGRTRTEISALSSDGRINEIARMLGSNSTEKSLDHVREMLENAAQLKAEMLTREDGLQ